MSTAEPTEPSAAQPSAALIEEQVTPPMTEKLASKMVDEGRGVATAIDAAVKAIDGKQLAEAKTEVAKALDGLAKLSADRPTVDVAVELWRKDKELDITELEGAVDTVPLLATLTRVDVPVYNRQEIEARHAQRKEQKPSETSKTEKASDLEVVDSNLVYLEVDMPIAATKLDVEEARRLLDEGKADAAKGALQRAVSSCDVIEVVAKAPEYRARTLVWAAENAFTKGDLAESARLIGEASDMLAPLVKREDDPQAQAMVTTLLAEMKPLQEALLSGNTEQSEGFRRIERDALSFARRTTLRSMMTLHHRAEHHALADALMWLEKAETDGVSEQQSNAAASTDLERAMTVLAQAAKEGPPSAANNFTDLHNRVERVAELDRASSRDSKAIESMLRGVIFDLRMLMLEIGTSPMTHEKGPA